MSRRTLNLIWMRDNSKVQKLFWAVAERKTSLCYQVLPTLSSVTQRRSIRIKQMKPKPAQNAETSMLMCYPEEVHGATEKPACESQPSTCPESSHANVAPLPPTWVDAPQHTNISRIVHCHSLYLKGYYEYWDWCAQLKEMSQRGSQMFRYSFSLGPSFLPIEPSPPLLTYECYVKFNFRVFKIVLFNYLYILVSGCLCGHGLFVRHIWFIWVALLWAGAACMGNHDKT